jgi:hypothetical protein
MDGRRLSGQLDRAAVVGEHPGEDVHQRRLAGAVLAKHGSDLTFVHGQRDTVEGTDAWAILW